MRLIRFMLAIGIAVALFGCSDEQKATVSAL